MSIYLLDTKVHCEHARNMAMQKATDTLRLLDGDGVSVLLNALLGGPEAMKHYDEDVPELVRILSVPTVIAEVQRRLELEELEG